MDGDLIMLIRAPYSTALVTQDILHRFWLVTTLRAFFVARSSEPRAQKSKEAFEYAIATYNLPLFVARLEAIRMHKEKRKKIGSVGWMMTPAAKRQDLQACFEQAMTKYAELEQKEPALFDFTRTYPLTVGGTLIDRVIRPALKNVCLDMNQHTKMLSRILAENADTSVESGHSLARKFLIEDNDLAHLVRDVIHSHHPRSHASPVASPERKMTNDSINVAQIMGEKRSADGAVATDHSSRKRVYSEAFQQQSSLSSPASKIRQKSEDERLESVLRSAAAGAGLVEHEGRLVQNCSADSEPVVQESRQYCRTCDVPGHHTSDCPRRQFFEKLRRRCAARIEDFYAASSGICPHNNSSINSYFAGKVAGKSGIMRYQKQNSENQRRYICSVLPPVPTCDLRWVAD